MEYLSVFTPWIRSMDTCHMTLAENVNVSHLYDSVALTPLRQEVPSEERVCFTTTAHVHLYMNASVNYVDIFFLHLCSAIAYDQAMRHLTPSLKF